MMFCSKSLFFSFVLWAITSKSAGQLVITGHEGHLIIGLPRDIQCIWNGDSNATLMEWFVVGLEAVAVESATDTKELVLSLDPDSNGLDGAMFTCRATLSDGRKVEESITLVVKEIINMVNITSSLPITTAGQQFTLTCTVTSERPSEVTWIDPNGVPCPLDSPDVSVSQPTVNGQTRTVVMTFRSIRTSQCGRYKCISNITYPPSKKEDRFLVRVQIPEPTVSILRDPVDPEELFTTDSLVLTCVIALIPEVDSYVTISSQWRGHSSLTDSERRVIVSDLEGVQLVYNTSVTFSTLKSSDSGSYVCSATVSPDISDLQSQLVQSPIGVTVINISVVLKVTIEVTYNPPSDFTLPSPPYYRPASTVTLTCRAHHATGTVSYRWSSTCSSCFASSSTSQTISETILKSNSAGVHTCTVTDSDGNTGSNSTEMRLIGVGLYVSDSNSNANTAISNNTLIVGRGYRYSSRYRYRTYTVYCYSNSTSSNVGYYIFPNGGRYNSGYNNVHISRQTPSGIQVYYNYRSGGYWGIFTCELPDSNGNTVQTSIGIYTSMPGAPSVYSSRYSDLSNTNGNLLGSLECLTQNSPPTTVTWLRDGLAVHVDGERYEMIQNVIERQSYSKYNNTLLIRDAADLVGVHTYTCSITNSAGSTSQNINTRLTAHPVVNISVPEEAIYLEPFNMTCRATLNRKVASQLIHYMMVEWVRVDGQSIRQDDGVIIEHQQTYSDTAIRSLIFDSLKMAHGGNYRCEASLILPDSAVSFNTSALHHINVLNRTIIQLKFGPVVHCSKWYEDRRIAQHLEEDIKEALTSVINKNCSCNFQTSQIDDGEFSCRTLQDMVMYRAHLTSSSDTLTLPDVLAILQDWVTNDGTFLYTYHGRIRLGLDQHCPLEVASFSHSECNGVIA